MRYYVIAFLLFIVCFSAGAQLPAEVIITKYNETNGISNGKVTAMLQGKKGYLWFGTTNGLLCFDSYTFRQCNNSTITNSITALAEDSNHYIWMSFLGGGLASFNPATGTFVKYKLHNENNPLLENAETSKLFFDKKGQLWMAMQQYGLVKADVQKNNFTVYDIVDEKNTFYASEIRKVYNTVYDIYEDDEGILWLCTHDGLYQFNIATKQMRAIRATPLQKNARRLDLFRSVVANGDTLWLGAWAGGVSSYNKKTNEWKSYLADPDKIQDPLYNLVIAVAEKSATELWVGSIDNGLGIFNKITKQFYFFNRDKNKYRGPGPTSVWANLIIDKDKNVWGITLDGLVKIQLPGYKFLFQRLPISTIENAKHFVTDMWEDDSLQLVATSFADGLHVTNKLSGSTTIFPVDSLPNEEPKMQLRQIIKDNRNNFWVLSRDFIYQYDRAKNKLIKIAQPPAYTTNNPSSGLTKMAEDKDGNLWIATRRNGVFLYHTQLKSYTHYSNQQKGNYFLNTTFISGVAVDVRGRVWLGGPFNFLGYADPGSKNIMQWHTGNTDTIKLPGSQVASLFADNKGNIWAGTYNGLCFFDCSGPAPVLKKIFRANDGLRANLVTAITQDAKGNIWCITEAAVCMINNNGQVSSYDATDGITEGGTGVKIAKGTKDTMRLLTAYGYYNFTSSVPVYTNTNLPLLITKMLVNDKEFCFADIVSKKGRIDLSPSQNVFSLELAAIDFVRPDKQQYQYMLKGFDKSWIDAGNRRFVTYTNLPGGNYTFYYRATSTPGNWNVPVQELKIHIATVFYKTIWFILLVILIIAVLLYRYFTFRTRRTRKLHELQLQATRLEKDKTAIQYQNLINQFNPHFLFNSLTSLNSLIYDNKELASEFLEQLSAVYRYLLTHKESQLVTLEEEIAFVKHYISLLKTRFEDGLEITIAIPEEVAQYKVVPVTFQLLIENAIKHNIIDAGTPLCISFTADNHYLHIANNLQKKGFVETSNRKGLESLKTLYKYLSASPLLVEETSDTFIIKVPLL